MFGSEPRAPRRFGGSGEAEARAFVEHTALMLAASVVTRTGPAEVADALVQTRLLDKRGRTTGPVKCTHGDAILARLSLPAP